MPLRPLVFETLLALTDGDQHGWALIRELEQRTGGAILPGNFYRTLHAMMADGLVEEIDDITPERRQVLPETGLNAGRRRYLRITGKGRETARAEARRMADLVAESRARRLLTDRK
jgi:DNA-binding PadR family transcriptional regulator